MAENAQFVTGVDEHGNPANVGAGLDRHGRLTLFTPPNAHEVHLDPDTAAEFQKILRTVNVEGWLPS